MKKLQSELALLVDSFMKIQHLELLQRDCLALVETKLADLWTGKGIYSPYLAPLRLEAPNTRKLWDFFIFLDTEHAADIVRGSGLLDSIKQYNLPLLTKVMDFYKLSLFHHQKGGLNNLVSYERQAVKLLEKCSVLASSNYVATWQQTRKYGPG